MTATISGCTTTAPKADFVLLSFRSNTLDCTADLLDNYSGQLSLPTNISYAGVDVRYGQDNPNLSPHYIGVLGTPPNVFRNLRNGILAVNSSLAIVASRFENIQTDNGYSLSGYGIRSVTKNSGLTFRQRGLGVNPLFQATFDHCENTGIFLRNMVVESIRGNRMIEMEAGVEIIAGQLITRIFNNSIEAETQGIGLDQMAIDCFADVFDNQVKVVGANGIGIRLNQTGTPPGNNGVRQFNNNSIRLDQNGTIGFDITKDEQVLINANQVTAESGWTTYYGIKLNDIGYGAVCSNTIKGNGVFSGDNYGIYAAGGKETYLVCNTIDSVSKALYYPVNSLFATNKLLGNALEDYDQGLTIAQSAIIGLQVAGGNLWLESAAPDPIGAIHLDPFFSTVEQSKFLTNSQAPPIKPEVIVTQPGVMESSFFDFVNIPDYSCPEAICNFAPLQSITADTNFYAQDWQIARDSFVGQDFTYEWRWRQRDYLFEKISHNPTFLATVPAADSFYQAALPTELQSFWYLDSLYYAGHSIGDSLHGALAARLDSIVLVQDLVLENDSIYYAIGLPGWPAEKDSLQTLTMSLAGQNTAVWDSLWQLRIDLANDMTDFAGSIDTDSLYGENLQDIWLIIASRLAKGDYELDSAQVITLQNMAGQCPIIGGPGVYAARSILTLTGVIAAYPSEDSCAVAFRSPGKASLLVSTVGLRIYPNPSSGEIYFESPWEGQSEMRVYDLAGRLLWSGFFVQKGSIDSGTLRAGMYFLETKQQDKRAIKPFVVLE